MTTRHHQRVAPRLLNRALSILTVAAFTSATFATVASAAEELPDDTVLETRIAAAFSNSEDYADTLVRVDSHRGFILLTGQVPRIELKNQATNTVVFTSSAIRRIINELEVVATVDNSTAEDDAVLETTVNDTLQALDPPPAAAVDVVVHKGVVYLLGAVENAEAQRLATRVSSIGGVASIRTAFEIMPQN